MSGSCQIESGPRYRSRHDAVAANVVESTPESLAARGQLVDVHELFDGTVGIRYRDHALVATPFRKDGAVRQQDVAENKYLATILERLRQNQIADDAQNLVTGTNTKRAKRRLSASLEAHRAPAS